MKPLASTFLLLVSLLGFFSGWSRSIQVADVTAFDAAVKQAQPGDTIVLGNGVWENALLVFRGKGTAREPIVLKAETPGKVSLEGKSRLRISGEYLLVSGLYFRNGQTPGGGVIEFRESSDKLAFHCRVTDCVIEEFNNPDRMKEDIWVQLYGQHNRFDHNYLAGKKNGGVTLAVNLNDKSNQDNYHQIDHNFFGPRPPLGVNGGETIRVGVSTYSLTSSRTIIEENYFYQCNGEVEIVSIKSCDNIVRRNLFVECEGGLVLRHGNRNLIEGNFFLGNDKPHTGGVRVINAGHRILNNYFADLKGDDFRSALTIMNAVPNSPINRYHQVRDVLIANNTFVNCDNIELCAGKDLERTARPENVKVVNNVFYSPDTDSLFHIYDEISGITFEGNLVKLGSKPSMKGLSTATFMIQISPDGLQVPVSDQLTIGTETTQDITGASRAKNDAAGAVLPGSVRALRRPVTASQAGPSWFRPDIKSGNRTGKVWPVEAGKKNALMALCHQFKSGHVVDNSRHL